MSMSTIKYATFRTRKSKFLEELLLKTIFISAQLNSSDQKFHILILFPLCNTIWIFEN